MYISSHVLYLTSAILNSLWNIYNNKTQADTNHLNVIDAISWFYKGDNPDTSIILAEQELKLANTIPIQATNFFSNLVRYYHENIPVNS
jgi:hypothetical protein